MFVTDIYLDSEEKKQHLGNPTDSHGLVQVAPVFLSPLQNAVSASSSFPQAPDHLFRNAVKYYSRIIHAFIRR